MAQTFVANGTGAITRAEVEFGFIPEGTDLLFEIRTVDAAGVPTNVVLANTERNDLPAGDRGTRVSATFNSAAKVTANTAYALVLTNVSADVLVVNARNGDCGGPLFGSVQGSDTFVPQLALNLIFSVGP